MGQANTPVADRVAIVNTFFRSLNRWDSNVLTEKELQTTYKKLHQERINDNTGFIKNHHIVKESSCSFDKNHTYGANKSELMKACLSREFILLKGNMFLHAFKIFQLQISAVILATVFVQARKHHRTLEDGRALFFALNTITFTGFF
ncbi:hypothetical protein F3Y22_tig00111855pilonHSYRG00025 [Hibiscus syriacus]|uniref:Uncharacterized protein n=1 Tax=Hibiscus syriacus TaxID=106335 RepID=A0A6A2YBF1_HIBSY|nr:hypothetical protein F3Y22_tig00111855pilonHSYRG00025 [Hibiscus syriacus]